MELLFALPLLAIPVALPFMAKMIAKTLGRDPRLWFWLSIFLPLGAYFILLSLPDKKKKTTGQNIK